MPKFNLFGIVACSHWITLVMTPRPTVTEVAMDIMDIIIVLIDKIPDINIYYFERILLASFYGL